MGVINIWPPYRKALSLCDDRESYLTFLEDHGFHNQRIAYLSTIQEHEKAAEVCWAQKDFVEAVRHLLQSSSPSVRNRASACLLDGLRTETPYGTNHRMPNPLVKELLELARVVPFDEKDQKEVRICVALIFQF